MPFILMLFLISCFFLIVILLVTVIILWPKEEYYLQMTQKNRHASFSGFSPISKSSPYQNLRPSTSTSSANLDLGDEPYPNKIIRQYDLPEIDLNKYNSPSRCKSTPNIYSKFSGMLVNIFEKFPSLSLSISNKQKKCHNFDEKKLDGHSKSSFLVDSCTELDESAQQIIRNVWDRKADLDEIFVKNFGIGIRRRDLQTLGRLNWLNDEIVNFYIKLIIERACSNKLLPKVYAFETFFYPRLLQNGYSAVCRWTKRTDIFSYDVLIIPIHLTAHWCLCVVDFSSKRITYFDSLHGDNEICLETIRDYLCQESIEKKKTKFELDGWKFECTKNIPMQTNGSDCGVFVCQFAECAARRQPPRFDQTQMPNFRRRMVVEICQNELYSC